VVAGHHDRARDVVRRVGVPVEERAEGGRQGLDATVGDDHVDPRLETPQRLAGGNVLGSKEAEPLDGARGDVGGNEQHPPF
jgi:hypothetical protein